MQILLVTEEKTQVHQNTKQFVTLKNDFVCAWVGLSLDRMKGNYWAMAGACKWSKRITEITWCN
jgi:hypothetical protein